MPTFVIEGDQVVVTVNHVMQEDHFIEWIAFVTNNCETKVYLNPGQDAVAKFKLEKGAKIYAYCNKHGLWSTELN